MIAVLIIGAVIVSYLAYLALRCAKREDEQMNEMSERIVELTRRMDAEEAQ